MSWTEQLQGQPGNFAPILQTITQADGQCLETIYWALAGHATATNHDLIDYVTEGTCVNFQDEIASPETLINAAAIATLKAVGVILTSDNIHLGLTPLGYGFMQTMLATEN